MPNSAIASGCIDFILPPEQIAAQIIKIITLATRKACQRDVDLT
jgi:chemotaxis response regulator CheB